jgi:hypothetical protein
MRKLYAIVCLALLSNAYKAQESLPYYQQYLLDGEFLFNPAQYGKTDYVQLNLNYQQQFSKFSESPNVQSVGINANIFDRVGAGFLYSETATALFLQEVLQRVLLILFL